MTFERRVLISCAAIVVALGAQLAYVTLFGALADDLYFPICGAQAILEGVDPYAGACTISDGARFYPSNPMTAVVLALPFARFGYLGALTMWSCFVGVLVFAILQCGRSWQLLILSSAPFWHAFRLLQWSPLLTAVVLVPALLPIALVKPQLGLPIVLTRLTLRRALACAAFAAATLAIDPYWPGKWLSQTLTYDGFVPAGAWLTGPLLLGMILCVGVANPRDWRTRFMFLSAVMPQRWFYDPLPLAALARTPAQLLVWSACSWIGFAAGADLTDRYRQQIVALLYFPLVIPRILQVIAERRGAASRTSP